MANQEVVNQEVHQEVPSLLTRFHQQLRLRRMLARRASAIASPELLKVADYPKNVKLISIFSSGILNIFFIEGGGGSFTWGKPGCELTDKAAKLKGADDPNYDPFEVKLGFPIKKRSYFIFSRTQKLFLTRWKLNRQRRKFAHHWMK